MGIKDGSNEKYLLASFALSLATFSSIKELFFTLVDASEDRTIALLAFKGSAKLGLELWLCLVGKLRLRFNEGLKYLLASFALSLATFSSIKELFFTLVDASEDRTIALLAFKGSAKLGLELWLCLVGKLRLRFNEGLRFLNLGLLRCLDEE